MDEVFHLKAPFQPTGDQPQAIEALVQGINEGDDAQTLLGVTGSGKTFIGLTFKRKRCTFFPTVAFAKSNR